MGISMEKKVCEICGGDGFEELLITCSKCRKSSEHVYCFRKNLIEIPDEWNCEDCEQEKLIGEENSLNPSENGETQKGIARINDSDHKRKKAVPSGKVKFIDAEEVIRLSSGGTKFGSPSKTNSGFRYNTCASPKSSPLKSKPNPKGLISVEPSLHKRNQISSISSLRPNRTDKRVSFHLMTGSGCEKQKNEKVKAVKTCSVNVLIKETEKPDAKFIIQKQDTSDKKIDDAANASLGSSPTTVHQVPIVGTEIDICTSSDPVVGSTEVEVVTTMPIDSAYLSYFPVEEEIWRGGFKFPDTVMPGKFYGGFKAHPPCEVSCKAYDFSSAMPIVLQVFLLPLDLVRGYLFQNPDLRDIAFYLFPSVNIKRSQETYSIVFKLLETENSVMTSCIGDVELLIFTSKQLNPSSHDAAQRFIGQEFLWAIFRQSKDKIPQKCGSPVDMEVDMEGGKPVGRVDMVVSDKSKTEKECSDNKRQVLLTQVFSRCG